MRKAVLMAVLVIAGREATADLAFELSKSAPLTGERVVVTVFRDGAPVEGGTIEALYRPNSETSRLEAVGRTDRTGAVEWTPSEPGIVNLTIESEGEQLTDSVSVRFGRFPLSGIAIMIFAGLILFGGAFVGLRNLLSEGAIGEEVLEEEPPST